MLLTVEPGAHASRVCPPADAPRAALESSTDRSASRAHTHCLHTPPTITTRTRPHARASQNHSQACTLSTLYSTPRSSRRRRRNSSWPTKRTRCVHSAAFASKTSSQSARLALSTSLSARARATRWSRSWRGGCGRRPQTKRSGSAARGMHKKYSSGGEVARRAYERCAQALRQGRTRGGTRGETVKYSQEHSTTGTS